MRYLYDRHKKDIPEVDPKNVSSGDEEGESDNEEREVKFF